MNASRAALVSVAVCFSLSCGDRSDVPVTRQLGWWPYQEGVEVTAFDAEISSTELHSNQTATLRLRIQGTCRHRESWRPEISTVHATERFEPSFADDERAAVIDFTPVALVRKDDAYAGTPEAFDVRIVYPVHTWTWNRNEVVVRCGPYERKIELDQRK